MNHGEIKLNKSYINSYLCGSCWHEELEVNEDAEKRESWWEMLRNKKLVHKILINSNTDASELMK